MASEAALPAEPDRYELLERIDGGHGNMGEVYRARDLRLDRQVAVKFLRGLLAADPLALHRFRREALATASLNHPNVLSVYDLALVDGVPCVVSELLEGRPLRDVLASGAPPLPDALDYAVQVASGLIAAHANRIVHRDLKPENLFLTRDGRVKILDFGLAKQADRPADPAASTASLAPTTKTGAILGTLAYLSPEQARGEEVDPRSDLFAFGAVLYELFSGRQPFSRGSEADTIAAVLDTDPPPPGRLNPAVPPLCDAIVVKALEKDRSLRYQSAVEMHADLKRAQRALTGGSSASHGSNAGTAAQERPSRRLLAAAIVVPLLAAAGGLSWLYLTSEVPAFDPSPLTAGRGIESEPALSPDGNLVAYTSEIDGNQDVYLLDRRTRDVRNLTDHPAADHHPSWMPDGGQILFVSDRTGEPSVWRMPLLGGAAVPIVADADEVDVAPDGRQIAFTRRVGSDTRIFAASLTAPDRARQLTTTADGARSHFQPAWSPDSRTISYAANQELWIVEASGGRPRQVAAYSDFESAPAWSHDGRSLYYSSSREGGQTIWRIDLHRGWFDWLTFWRPDGPQRVSRGSGSEDQPMVSRDGRILAFSTLLEDTNLALYDLRSGREEAWGTLQNESFPTLAPDASRVFYVSRADPPFNQLWSLPLHDGKPAGRPQRVTDHEGYVSHPACSPDGRFVAYFVGERGASRIWVVPAAGGPSHPVTPGPNDALPAWSPDGRQIVYTGEARERGDIWRVPVRDGLPAGPPARLTATTAAEDAPAWSGDGSLIAFRRESTTSAGAFDVWVMRPDGSGQRQVTRDVYPERVAWDESTPGALFVAGRWGGPASSFELRRIGALPGRHVAPLQPAVRMDADFVTDFSVSRDGKLLAFSRYLHQGSIWMWAARGGRRF